MGMGGLGVAPDPPPGSDQAPPAPQAAWVRPVVVCVLLAAIAVVTAGLFIFGFAVGCAVHWFRAFRRTDGTSAELEARREFRRGCRRRVLWAFVPLGLVAAAFVWDPNVFTRIAALACAIYACVAFRHHKEFNKTKERALQPDLFETDGFSRGFMRQADATSTNSTKTTLHDFFFGPDGEKDPTKWELFVTWFCVAVALLAGLSLLVPSPPLTPNLTLEVWIKQEANNSTQSQRSGASKGQSANGTATTTPTTAPHSTPSTPTTTPTVSPTTTTSTTEPPPCATPKAFTNQLMTDGVPGDVAKLMETKWSYYIHQIGCPQGEAVQQGSIWVEALGAISIPNAYLIGTTKFAQVLFPDFETLVRPVLSQLSSTSSRYRWGLGTAMGLDYSNGSCSIAESYNSQPAILPPQSVVALAAEAGGPLNAFPRFLPSANQQGNTIYTVVLYSPDAAAPWGVSAVSTLTITYDPSSGTSTAPGFAQVSDDALCLADVANLESLAAGLETSSAKASS